MDIFIQVGIGVLGGLVTAALLRFIGHAFDFVPRKISDIGIGSSFEPFTARGPGDNYDNVLWLRIQNHSASPIYIIRAVYFAKNANIPVYSNAVRSQKYQNGYEVKFGAQWKEMSYIILPKENEQSYVPLAKNCDDSEVPQGKRGELLLEYVHDGKTFLTDIYAESNQGHGIYCAGQTLLDVTRGYIYGNVENGIYLNSLIVRCNIRDSWIIWNTLDGLWANSFTGDATLDIEG